MTAHLRNARTHTTNTASVGVLRDLVAWEAELILDLRLWFDSAAGQSHVWNEFRRALPAEDARRACLAFESLLETLTRSAYRPLMRHRVACPYIGADEAVFVQLVRLASDGHLTDAVLIAGLLVGPARAEHVAILAGDVGTTARGLRRRQSGPALSSAAPERARLH